MFTLIGLQTKCFHVIVFKRLTTPLSSMTSHVMHACDAFNSNNNMQQHAKLLYPF